MARILIVDDEPDVVLTLEFIVSESHEVVATSDPAEAARLLEEQAFDVLLTDIRMPDMDGFDLARIARAANPRMRIVFVSAYAFDRDGDARLEAARQDALICPKPLSVTRLERAISEALEHGIDG